MSRMSLLFWIVAGCEAVLLVVMLVSFSSAPRHSDGGKGMAIFFFVLVPGAVLVAAMLLHALVDSPVARGIALLVVAVPGLLFVGDRLRDRRIDQRVADQHSGAGYFEGADLREMGRAVVRRDPDAVRRIGPTVDVNAIGLRGMTLMELAVEHRAGAIDEQIDDALPVVNALLALGAKPDPALPRAVQRNASALLQALLTAGADPRGVRPDGGVLVFDWISTMTPSTLQILIDHGLDPDLRSHGNPLAVQVTIYQRWDLLPVLIAAGADLALTRDDGRHVAGELAAQTANELASGHAVPGDLLRATALVEQAEKRASRP